MPYLFGIDIGGTKIALAAVTPDGAVLAERAIETRAHEGAPRVIARLIAALHSIEPDDRLLGIGIGSTGPLDITRGRIQNPYTLPTFEDVDIVTPLAQEFHTPVILENDCDAAALGEAWRGAGQRVRNMIYVTVGTGIGAGLILEGKLYHGVGLMAGEFGHMTIAYRGVECYCGNRGCLEMLAAGPAIAKAYQARKAAAEYLDGLPSLSKMGEPELSARDVIDLAQVGDPIAQEIVHEAAEYLGIGLANLITLLAPDVIVLGGGVMERFELFAPTLYETIAQRVTLVPARQVRLRRAALGRRAGVIGAAKAALDRL